jgi:hypothetical protein
MHEICYDKKMTWGMRGKYVIQTVASIYHNRSKRTIFGEISFQSFDYSTWEQVDALIFFNFTLFYSQDNRIICKNFNDQNT